MHQPHSYYAFRYLSQLNIPPELDLDFLKNNATMPLADMSGRIYWTFNKIFNDEKLSKYLGIPVKKDAPSGFRDTLSATLANLYLASKRGINVYKICGEFGHALNKAPVNVPAKHLNFNDQISYVELPASLKLFPSSHHQGFYATCCKISDSQKQYLRETPGTEHIRDASYTMTLYIPSKLSSFSDSIGSTVIQISLRDDDSIAEAIHNALKRYNWNYFKPEAFEYIAKALLYINSGDPDLRHLEAVKETRGQMAWKRRAKHEYKIALTLVGFNYKKPFLYGKSETLVSTHPRWQPCGKNREQIKLIWVREHVRHYAAREVT